MKRGVNRYHIIFIVSVVIATLLFGCSQESNSLVSKAYHNTTANFNAYYLAKTRMHEMEENLVLNQQFDFNTIVEIYPQWDTNYAMTVKADLDYIFEKAALPTLKHKNSKWVDNSNILLAKTKFYACKNDSTAIMLRYVNTHGTDINDRHEALVLLLRTYLREGQGRYAREVKNYLDKEKLNNKNQHEYHLALAEYARFEGDYALMLDEMEKAIKLAKAGTKLKARNLTRYHFIAGQLHQRFGNEEEAYKHYKQSLKRNPPYEFEFFAKLNMAQCSPIDNPQEIKKINKYFKHIAAEEKNAEYRDKIYYEEGLFEYKQHNTPQALHFFNKSIQDPLSRPIQNAYTYLKLGEIYYEDEFSGMKNTEKFKTAKLYYDSSVTNLNERMERYEEIIERKDILTEFVEQLEMIEAEDSLQMMALLTEEEREEKIDKAIEWEKKQILKAEEDRIRKEEKERKRAEQAAIAAAQSGSQPQTKANASFPFYSPNLMFTAKQKFEDKWGFRKLEDNWRRSKKEFILDDQDIDIIQDADSNTLATNPDSVKTKNKKSDKLTLEDIEVDREKFYASIPFTPEALAASNEKLKKAYFKLGKIYDQKLVKPEDAIVAFQTLIARFPDHENYVEVLYNLYLLCEKSTQCNSELYANEILTDYPNSIYARLVENPNYAIDNFEANKIVRDLYENAYNTYQNGAYIKANMEVNKILHNYPITDIKDKLVLLKILTLAKTDQFDQYEKELHQFKNDFPTSNIIPYVDELIANQQELSSETSFTTSDTTYTFTPDTTHLVIFASAETENAYRKVMDFFYEFHQTYYKKSDFSIRRMELDTNRYVLSVKDFDNKSTAKDYLDKLNHYIEFRNAFTKTNYEISTISFSNYRILQRKKDVDEYRTFYRKKYTP